MHKATVSPITQNVTISVDGEAVTIVDSNSTQVTVANESLSELGHGFHIRPMVRNPISGKAGFPFDDDLFWQGGSTQALAWNPDFDAGTIIDFGSYADRVTNTSHPMFGLPLPSSKALRLYALQPQVEPLTGQFGEVLGIQTREIELYANRAIEDGPAPVMYSAVGGGISIIQRRLAQAFTGDVEDDVQAEAREFLQAPTLVGSKAIDQSHMEYELHRLSKLGIDGGTF